MLKFLKRTRDDEGVEAASKAPKAVDAELSPPTGDVATLTKHLSEPGWVAALKKEMTKGYFTELASKVIRERASKTVFPPAESVFNAFNWTPLDQVNCCRLIMQAHM